MPDDPVRFENEVVQEFSQAAASWLTQGTFTMSPASYNVFLAFARVPIYDCFCTRNCCDDHIGRKIVFMTFHMLRRHKDVRCEMSREREIKLNSLVEMYPMGIFADPNTPVNLGCRPTARHLASVNPTIPPAAPRQ